MKYWYNGNKWGGEIVLFTPQEAAELIPAKIKGESVHRRARLGRRY